ncbi:WhiB family transcriptional regulator [Nocardia sp. CA2R105]|uniref:WhiB family transcriptional regulator n=1 Tax=Nocardia coffeae TaxID=2873381 RepID=UPI001CA6FA00|nr:WhiB family transcriptional regulator [Nocardia coffeae]MBY8862372.1 WhiB family transcriptional regulator [Nocardia coffeae]
MSQREWRTRAACRKYPPELWWPEQRGRLRVRVVAPVIEICWSECPVRPRCAQQALDDGARHGIWGGVDLSDGRRGRLKQARKALRGSAATPTELDDYPEPPESSDRRSSR